MINGLVRIAAILFFVLFAAEVNAARYFVSSVTGNDKNSVDDAQSVRKPWKTIQRAIDVAVAGDTVIVLPESIRSILAFEDRASWVGQSRCVRLCMAKPKFSVRLAESASLTSV